MSRMLPELFRRAESALHPQSLVARQEGMEAIYSIEEEVGIGLAPPEEPWNELPDAVKRDIVHDTGLARIFIELQREADKRGIDVDYGLRGMAPPDKSGVDVYLHRSSDGYAFVSFGGPEPADPVDDSYAPPVLESATEYVESLVFGQPWADDWLSPYSPSDLDFLDPGEYEEAGHLPLERDRDEGRKYRVGRVTMDDDGNIEEVVIHYPEMVVSR